MNLEAARTLLSPFRSPEQAIAISSRTKRWQRIFAYTALMAMDCIVLFLCFVLGNLIRFAVPFENAGLNILIVILPIYILVALQRGVYSAGLFNNWLYNASAAVVAFLIAILAVLLIGFYLQASAKISREVFSIGVSLGCMSIFASRRWSIPCLLRLLNGQFRAEVFICDETTFQTVPGLVVIDAAFHELRPDIGDPHMLDRIGRLLNRADRVIISCPPERRISWALALKGANINGEILAPEIDDIGTIGTGRVGDSSTLLVSSGPLDTRSRALKRGLDLGLSISCLLILIPVLFLVSLAVKLESPGEVLFKQRRLGRGNRLFTMYKFRSMKSDMCDASGNRSTNRDDDRITRVGRFIRATSIDELPQLFNVLKGDMSFVGPRPHALGSLAGDKLFWEIDRRYWQRHASKPGLTGLAQIRGFRGATHAQTDLVNRLQADLEYLNEWTIWRDIAILLKTFKVIIHKNAY